jgi:hypothetical protein
LTICSLLVKPLTGELLVPLELEPELLLGNISIPRLGVASLTVTPEKLLPSLLRFNILLDLDELPKPDDPRLIMTGLLEPEELRVLKLDLGATSTLRLIWILELLLDELLNDPLEPVVDLPGDENIEDLLLGLDRLGELTLGCNLEEGLGDNVLLVAEELRGSELLLDVIELLLEIEIRGDLDELILGALLRLEILGTLLDILGDGPREDGLVLLLDIDGDGGRDNGLGLVLFCAEGVGLLEDEVGLGLLGLFAGADFAGAL